MPTSTQSTLSTTSEVTQALETEGWRGLNTLRNQAVLEHILTLGHVPDFSLAFRALLLTPPAKTRVVFLGQDPYPTLGQADGLAFSALGDKRPVTLNSFYRELQADLGIVRQKNTLEDWAKQGILLLNTALTTEPEVSGSHLKLWEPYVSTILGQLADLDRDILFVTFGGFAQKLLDRYSSSLPLSNVVNLPHPVPYQAVRGFYGSKIFSRVSAFMRGTYGHNSKW